MPVMVRKGDAKGMGQKPRFELEVYRQFIRDAAPYVSVVLGRRLSAADGNLLTDAEIAKIAVLIDERVKDLKPVNGAKLSGDPADPKSKRPPGRS